MAPITIVEYTDPGCPWAYSAEPARLRLRWRHGAQIDWRLCMVGLSESPEDSLARGFTPERQSEAFAMLAERFGQPFELAVRPRVAATVPACRAVVAARRHAPEREWLLLRALRVRGFAGELIDEPATIAAAARDAGLDAGELADWVADPASGAALAEDMRRARHPTAAALALDEKLAGPRGERRYACPSYEITGPDGLTLSAPGFQPAVVYEALIANVAPALAPREPPREAREVLEWAPAPPSSAEVAEVLGVSIDEARAQLRAVATLDPVGADGFWELAPLIATPRRTND